MEIQLYLGIQQNKDTTISWLSTKQTLVATQSNHAEIITIYDKSRMCLVGSMTQHIQSKLLEQKIPTIPCENNTTCIAQSKGGYIKGDRTKHIS